MNKKSKRMATELTDLPVEVLAIIMTMLGSMYNGGADVAKSMSLCKLLLKASNIIDDLAAIRFQNVKVENQHICFQQTKGLLYKCAQAGNISAQYYLAKVFLFTTTQLISIGVKKENIKDFSDNSLKRKKARGKYHEKARAAIFVSLLSPDPKSKSLSHWKIVKIFIANVNGLDLVTMGPHLQNYVEFFMGSTTYGTDAYLFMHFFRTMWKIHWRSWDTCLTFYQGNYYVKNRDEEFIYPLPQLRGSGFDKVIVDWKYAGYVYALVEAQALSTFDRLIEKLP